MSEIEAGTGTGNSVPRTGVPHPDDMEVDASGNVIGPKVPPAPELEPAPEHLDVEPAPAPVPEPAPDGSTPGEENASQGWGPGATPGS